MRLLSKTFSFRGRDTRTDFLVYIVASILAVVVGVYATLELGDPPVSRGRDDTGIGPFTVASVGAFVLAIAAVRFLSTCRRLRDAERSLWLVLLLFIPALGGLLTLMLLFSRSAPDRLTEEAVKVF